MKYADKNIYSRDGVLLLSQGQEMTDDIIYKLNTLDDLQYKRGPFQKYAAPKTSGNSVSDMMYNTHKQKIEESSQNLKASFQISQEKLLNESSLILNDILFCSKEKPWWLILNTYTNYIGWLYTHSINVALISEMIAMAMELPQKDVRNLALGALLHDIGKMMIPKNIILKEGALNDQEYLFMKQHCELGYSMVKEFQLDKTVTDAILQHHERLDGSGYPNHLTGEQIPVCSRIVMISDVLDAMTSYRPYKPSQEIYKALDELKGQASVYPMEIISAFEAAIQRQ